MCVEIWCTCNSIVFALCLLIISYLDLEQIQGSHIFNMHSHACLLTCIYIICTHTLSCLCNYIHMRACLHKYMNTCLFIIIFTTTIKFARKILGYIINNLNKKLSIFLKYYFLVKHACLLNLKFISELYKMLKYIKMLLLVFSERTTKQ